MLVVNMTTYLQHMPHLLHMPHLFHMPHILHVHHLLHSPLFLHTDSSTLDKCRDITDWNYDGEIEGLKHHREEDPQYCKGSYKI